MFKKVIKDTLITATILSFVFCIFDGEFSYFFVRILALSFCIFFPVLIYNLIKKENGKNKSGTEESKLKDIKINLKEDVPTYKTSLVIAFVIVIVLQFLLEKEFLGTSATVIWTFFVSFWVYYFRLTFASHNNLLKKYSDEEEKKYNELLKEKLPNGKRYIGSLGRGIVVDYEKKLIALIMPPRKPGIFDFGFLLKCEIVENKSSEIKPISLYNDAVILGNKRLEEVASQSKEIREYCKSLFLRIVIKIDYEIFPIEIPFIIDKVEINSPLYTEEKKLVKDIEVILNEIINNKNPEFDDKMKKVIRLIKEKEESYSKLIEDYKSSLEGYDSVINALKKNHKSIQEQDLINKMEITLNCMKDDLKKLDKDTDEETFNELNENFNNNFSKLKEYGEKLRNINKE